MSARNIFRRRPKRSPVEVVTPDDNATCALCGHETSLAMIAYHLTAAHDIDPTEIANAEVWDSTDPREVGE